MALEGFYPKNLAGYTVNYFNSYDQALPLISFVISMVTSSFGMTKFFLHGPVQLLPKNYPINGLISLPFFCTLLINCMFAVRMICIENAFFNAIRLLATGINRTNQVRKYPPILIACCFTHFMFEGCNGKPTKIWRFGTILNAFFIGCFTPNYIGSLGLL